MLPHRCPYALISGGHSKRSIRVSIYVLLVVSPGGGEFLIVTGVGNVRWSPQLGRSPRKAPGGLFLSHLARIPKLRRAPTFFPKTDAAQASGVCVCMRERGVLIFWVRRERRQSERETDRSLPKASPAAVQSPKPTASAERPSLPFPSLQSCSSSKSRGGGRDCGKRRCLHLELRFSSVSRAAGATHSLSRAPARQAPDREESPGLRGL